MVYGSLVIRVKNIFLHGIHQGLNSPAFFLGDADPLFILSLFSLCVKSFKRTDDTNGM